MKTAKRLVAAIMLAGFLVGLGAAPATADELCPYIHLSRWHIESICIQVP